MELHPLEQKKKIHIRWKHYGYKYHRHIACTTNPSRTTHDTFSLYNLIYMDRMYIGYGVFVNSV